MDLPVSLALWEAIYWHLDTYPASFLLANPYFQPNVALANDAIIDPSRISSVALNYFKNGLIPTSAAGYVFPEAAARTNHAEYLGKFDYTISPRDTLSGTFGAQDSPTTVPFSGSSGATTVNGYPVSDETAVEDVTARDAPLAEDRRAGCWVCR